MENQKMHDVAATECQILNSIWYQTLTMTMETGVYHCQGFFWGGE